MLNEKQLKSIELLISGEYQIQQIADAVGVSRQTIHKWRTENEEYQEYYQKRLQETTNAVSQKFNERLDVAVESLYDIITNPDVATRERKDACIYWINRVMGAPTNKLNIDKDEEKDNTSQEDILAALEVARVEDDPEDSDDNIIDFKASSTGN